MFLSRTPKKGKWYFDLLKTVVCLAAATGLSVVLLQTRDMGSTSLLYVLAVFAVSFFTDRYIWGIIASLAGVFLVNYFFVPPIFELSLLKPGYFITAVVLLVICLLTSSMTTRLKRHNQLVLDMEKEKMSNSLLRSISHDLRTPLTSIIGSSSIMMESDPPLDRETEKNLLKDINEESQWLLRMVENLLTVTRMGEETGRIQKFPEVAEEVMAEAVGRVRSRFPDRVIRSHVPDDLLIVPMDATLIEQVIINLVENAVKHSGEDAEIEVSLAQSDSWAEFEIRDNGKGISAEELKNLFLPYGMKAADPGDSSRNHGLGLSICKSIVRTHEGELTVDSVMGEGTIFKFKLPLDGEYEEFSPEGEGVDES
ncbi:MAG: DUF4118 domain-containing protein [Firmicutes bacterium]|nr:DUF4118 domain-containing protein [Bacillota bacterium]